MVAVEPESVKFGAAEHTTALSTGEVPYRGELVRGSSGRPSNGASIF